jgi:hypothetical protein
MEIKTKYLSTARVVADMLPLTMYVRMLSESSNVSESLATTFVAT